MQRLEGLILQIILVLLAEGVARGFKVLFRY